MLQAFCPVNDKSGDDQKVVHACYLAGIQTFHMLLPTRHPGDLAGELLPFPLQEALPQRFEHV